MRSLILAGGGLKVAYQAGCLQVLLDEAGITFDHVDAASGGCFNAALMASGKSGTEIADLWRTMHPADFTSLNFRELIKGPWFRSIGTADGLHHIFEDVWNLDFDRIRTPQATTYTFNHFDFVNKRVVVVENTGLDTDDLVAGVALPMWFSPVPRNASFIFDAVYCTDGNVGEAVKRGADEIWAIWTVADRGEYRSGFISEYFHVIETVADAKFRDEWFEIAAVNAGIAAHGIPVPAGRSTPDLRLREGYANGAQPPLPPPGRKTIEQHLIRQDVPMHYVLIFARDRMAAAVEMGIQDARQYVRAVLEKPLRIHPVETAPAAPPVGFEFTEKMSGFFMPGEHDYRQAYELGRTARNSFKVRLKIGTPDLGAFVVDPDHACPVDGTVDAPLLSSETVLTQGGRFNLFINDREPELIYPQREGAPQVVVAGHKQMRYELPFVAGGTAYVLRGKKLITDENGFSVWPDTTTLYVDIFTVDGPAETFYAAGILHVSLLDFLGEFPTMKAPGGKWFGIPAKLRFAQFFIGQCWDVYLRQLIEYAPF